MSASISVNPNPAEAGAVVTVSGQGFQPGEIVWIDFAGATIAQGTADASGQFITNGRIDASVPVGTHPLDANGDNGSWDTYDLTIVPAQAPAPAANPQVRFADPVPAGGSTVVRGTGFLPRERITINFGGSTVGTTVANRSGDWSKSITVPSHMPVGRHPLDIIGNMGTIVDKNLKVSAALPPVTAAPAPAPIAAPAPTPVVTPTNPTTTVPPAAPQTLTPTIPAAPTTPTATVSPTTPAAAATPTAASPTTPVAAATPATAGATATPQAQAGPIAASTNGSTEAQQGQRVWIRPSSQPTDSTVEAPVTVLQAADTASQPTVDQAAPAVDSSVSLPAAQDQSNGSSTLRFVLMGLVAAALAATVVTATMTLKQRRMS